eukprot:EC721260.1.p2 GENE.EC721260.1~~EC721260.1.p2  ORF type:complete len:65 (-),score=4.66 EC721260.1:126-320(-)
MLRPPSSATQRRTAAATSSALQDHRGSQPRVCRDALVDKARRFLAGPILFSLPKQHHNPLLQKQ